MVTVRGRTDARDGKIHSDSKSKLVTVLLYMNGTWEKPGGRTSFRCGLCELRSASRSARANPRG